MYPIDFDDFKRFLDGDPIIVLDTNVYLNMYDYTPENLNIYLNTFSCWFDKLWLPDQVLNEFFENYETVKKRNFKKYDFVPQRLRSYLDRYKNAVTNNFSKYEELKYPLIRDLLDEIKREINTLEKITFNYEQKIKKYADKNSKTLQSDNVAEFVYQLFENGQFGYPFTLEEQLAIHEEGELRYKDQIPPGYADANKNDPTNRKKFGDLILWKQILHKAKMEQSSLLFLTNDNKEDWWELDNGRVVGVRKELINEFTDVVDEDFLMINSSLFINYHSMIHNLNIDKTISFLENNKVNLCSELFSKANWGQILKNEKNLELHLTHSDDLLPHISNAFQSVIIVKYPDNDDVNWNAIEVDCVDGKAIILGTFSTNLKIRYVNDQEKDHISKGSGTCWINGRFVVSFYAEILGMDVMVVKESEDIFVGRFEVVGYLETV